MVSNMCFSYQSYEMLMQYLKMHHYNSVLIGDISIGKKSLYLRHDVDTDYLGVLAIANIEHSLNMRSTWYFLPDSPVYNMCSSFLKTIITRVHQLGHQVGLHIDASQYKNLEEMTKSLDSYYDFFSSILPISKTFSFHKPANWLLKDIMIPNWVNAYQKEYYSEVMYVSDSNRREFWNEDRLHTAIIEQKSLTLLTHPLWWKNASYSLDGLFAYSCEVLGSNIVSEYLKETCKSYSK